MHSRILLFVFTLLTLSILSYCSATLKIPTKADSDFTGTSLDTLTNGRELYINSCGNCHNLHLPNERTKVEWSKTLGKMKIKAKTSEEQTGVILKYLEAYAKK